VIPDGGIGLLREEIKIRRDVAEVVHDETVALFIFSRKVLCSLFNGVLPIPNALQTLDVPLTFAPSPPSLLSVRTTSAPSRPFFGTTSYPSSHRFAWPQSPALPPSGANSQVVFHFTFTELKGVRRVPGEAMVQNQTAMRIGLGIIVQLQRRASAVPDSQHCLPLSPVMRRVYGVRTSGSVVTLDTMIYEEGPGEKKSYVSGVRSLTLFVH